MKKLPIALSALLLGFATASSVQAVPLQDLLDGASIEIGDKIFDQWELVEDVVSTDPAFDPNLSLIDVTAGVDRHDTVLNFAANGQLRVEDFNFVDLFFGFHVATKSGAPLIKDIALELDTGTITGTDPLVFVAEDVLDADDVLLASLSALVDTDIAFPFDAAEFDILQSGLFVTKNILLSGDADGDIAELIAFEQRFSQVPEPSVLLLIIVGLIGIEGLRRRYATQDFASV